MSSINSIKAPKIQVAETADVLQGKFIKDSGVIRGNIAVAYMKTSAAGAVGVHLEVKLPDNTTYSEDLWIQGKPTVDAKTQEPIPGKSTYFDKNSNTERYIPGMEVVSTIVKMITGKTIGVDSVNEEEKLVKVWDYEAKAEVPTKVMVLSELTNKPIALGVLKTIEDVNEKAGNVYVPSGYSTYKNTISRVFNGETGQSISEMGRKAEATFMQKWIDRNDGYVADKTSKRIGYNPKPRGAAGGATAQAAKKTTSVFGAK